MATDIGPKIGIDGEAEFRKQITNINQQLKTLGSEMKAVTSAFTDNADSQEALTARSETLTKQITAQQSKLELLKKGLAESAEKFGENDTKTLKWQQAVNDATAELNGLQTELKTTTSRMGELDAATDEVAVSFDQTAFDHIEQQLKTLGSEMSKSTSAFLANGDSQQALASKSSVLKKEIEAQQQKITLLNNALEDSAAKFGENDTETLKWQQQVNEATAELNGMQAELKKTEDGLNDTGDELDESSGKFDKFKSIISGVGAALGAVATAAGAASIAVAKQVVNAFSELEQNLGGSVAVFEDYADDIQKVGEEAYKNLGISQSEYLATANKMSALFQGSGITDMGENFELTTQAMQRAADMASVMGIDVSAALEAVTGAAKGNFTMMDNLGVAINATALNAYAMEKGLAGVAEVDLSKLADAQADLEKKTLAEELAVEKLNAAIAKYGEDSTQAAQAAIKLEQAQVDVEKATRKVEEASGAESASSWYATADSADKARVAMQMFLETTEKYSGNFAREATQTITGSLGLLESAIDSFVAGLGNADADTQNLTQNVMDAFGAVVANITPVLENIVSAIPAAADEIIVHIGDLLPTLLTTVTDLFESVLETILGLLPELIPVAVDALLTIVDTLIDNLPMILDAALQIIISLVQGITQSLPELIPAATSAILTVVDTLLDNTDKLIDAALELVIALAEGLIAALPEIIERVPEIILKLYDAFVDNLPKIMSAGAKLIDTLLDGIFAALPDVISKIPEIIIGIIEGFLEGIPQFIDAGENLIESVAGGIASGVPEILRNIGNLVKQMIGAFKDKLGDFADIGKNLIEGIWDGISGAGDWLWEKITDFGSNIADAFKDVFGIHSPSTVMRDEVGKYLAQGIGAGFENEMDKLAGTMTKSIPTPSMAFDSAAAGIINGMQTLTAGNAGIGGNMRIEIPVIIDGKELYRHTINDLRSVMRANPVAGAST